MTEKETFLALVRSGIGRIFTPITGIANWSAIEALAAEQGLSAIVVDGIAQLPKAQKPPEPMLLQWIEGALQQESQFAIQQKAAIEIALLFHHNEIRTYVLKGAVVSECYPNPMHRNSADMDCFLLPNRGEFDAWGRGNYLILRDGFEVSTSFYKNSTFILPGLVVENHKFLTPFRGNKNLKRLERVLQCLLRVDKGEDIFEGTFLCRPPVMVSALFLIEHAYSHFLHEGLTWRHVMDWMMFSKKHQKEIDWLAFEAYIDEFRFRKFYDSYNHLGKYLLGEIAEDQLTEPDKKMLADVWAPLDVHETTEGLKGKLCLAGNTWRARWKYRLFTDMSWVRALWIQARGVLFEKEVKLS